MLPSTITLKNIGILLIRLSCTPDYLAHPPKLGLNEVALLPQGPVQTLGFLIF